MQGNRNRHGERANERRRQSQKSHAQSAHRRQREEGDEENARTGNETRNGYGSNGHRNGNGNRGHRAPMHGAAEVAVRGAALLIDLQFETVRNLWRAQARSVSMLGVPDYSEMFRFGDERARQILTASAEQWLESARHARETVAEVQRQIGRLAEQQAIGFSEEVRDQIEQMGRRTEEGLRAIQQVTVEEADELEQAMYDEGRGSDGERGGSERDDEQFALAHRSDDEDGEHASRRGRRAG